MTPELQYVVDMIPRRKCVPHGAPERFHHLDTKTGGGSRAVFFEVAHYDAVSGSIGDERGICLPDQTREIPTTPESKYPAFWKSATVTVAWQYRNPSKVLAEDLQVTADYMMGGPTVQSYHRTEMDKYSRRIPAVRLVVTDTAPVPDTLFTAAVKVPEPVKADSTEPKPWPLEATKNAYPVKPKPKPAPAKSNKAEKAPKPTSTKSAAARAIQAKRKKS